MRWSRYAALIALLPVVATPCFGQASDEDQTGTIALLGEKVKGLAGEDMGRVVNVLVDRDGRITAAIIDFGGFLGVGSRKIAVDWRYLMFRPDDPQAPVILVLEPEVLRKAPEYKPAGKSPPAGTIVGSPSTAPAGPP